mgnify:CR=1 FL=1
MNQPKFHIGQAVSYVYAVYIFPIGFGGDRTLQAAGRIEDCQSRGTEFFYKVNSNWFPESKLKEVLQ